MQDSSPLTTVLCKNLDYCESKFVIVTCTNFDSKLSKFLLRTLPLNGQKHLNVSILAAPDIATPVL